ncbi:MAG TPA: hypothetical protein VK541_18610 [Pedobacter sp.]|uniref:hypothetical protein n=1 Tax=Pedobacter sp. TaxID=1411316 RepID=UPI002BD35D62|nr:hypothetical protein [Pedobacter sp.]HMI04509.1 hypothetical protein [Pedobacter sp.]
MKRKLLFAERMLHGDGTVPFNAVIPWRIKGSILLADLRHALRKLQRKHAMLNAAVVYDEVAMPWFWAGGNEFIDIPVRIADRVSEDDWKKESIAEWAIPFDTAKGPLIRMVWIRGGDISEFIMVIHHCLCDGGSAMAILEELLLVLNDPDADIGKEKQIMGIEDVVPQEILNSRKQLIKSKLIGGIANLFLWLVPVNKKLVERKTDYMIHWKLDQGLSERLVKKCRDEGVTVNTAFCVALLNAFQSVRKAGFHNKVSCPVDIRRFAPQIKRDNIFAFGLMFVVSSDKDLDFFSDAWRMQKDIDRKTAKLNPYSTLMMMEESHSALNNFTKFLKYGKSTNDCMFSNLGRIGIAHQYKSFEVETIFSPSVIGPLGNTTTMITSTYRGQMDFTFIASEGFLPYEDALSIKDKMMDIMSAL